MFHFWEKYNFRIKHQLYLRILPVVVLAVLGVGLFSGRLLTTRAVNTYLEQEGEQQDAVLSKLLSRISLRALAAEFRLDQATLAARPGREDTQAPDYCGLGESFLELEKTI